MHNLRAIMPLEAIEPRMRHQDLLAQACFCLHARMTARVVTRAYDAVMKTSGLKVTQFSVLAAIARQGTVTHPAGTGALSEAALAKLLAMERTTLVRTLKLLTARELIAPVPGSGREIAHRLTQAGQTLLDEAIPLWAATQDEIRSRLDQVDVLDHLRKLRRAAAQKPERRTAKRERASAAST